MVFGTACALTANLWFALHSNECVQTDCMNVVIPPMLLLGIALGQLTGTIWNSILYLVPKKNIGPVVGVMSSLVNT